MTTIAKIQPGDGDPRHGTPNGYQNLKCRCTPCRAANTAYCYERKQKRHERPTPEHAHGTTNGYGNWGCRCRPCTDAWNAAHYERIHRLHGGVWPQY